MPRTRLAPNIFSELVAPRSDEERFVAYVIREHRLGRPIAEILDDPYLCNRLTDEQRMRLLEHPDLVRGVARELARAARRTAGAAGRPARDHAA